MKNVVRTFLLAGAMLLAAGVAHAQDDESEGGERSKIVLVGAAPAPLLAQVELQLQPVALPAEPTVIVNLLNKGVEAREDYTAVVPVPKCIVLQPSIYYSGVVLQIAYPIKQC